uniref:Uncharacterized protein LOC114342574 n=1 Tax=Diabrotica virgifera virgifera TaxID=50390 RepID=A0A6P7GHA2_DIAVI
MKSFVIVTNSDVGIVERLMQPGPAKILEEKLNQLNATYLSIYLQYFNENKHQPVLEKADFFKGYYYDGSSTIVSWYTRNTSLYSLFEQNATLSSINNQQYIVFNRSSISYAFKMDKQVFTNVWATQHPFLFVSSKMNFEKSVYNIPNSVINSVPEVCIMMDSGCVVSNSVVYYINGFLCVLLLVAVFIIIYMGYGLGKEKEQKSNTT